MKKEKEIEKDKGAEGKDSTKIGKKKLLIFFEVNIVTK